MNKHCNCALKKFPIGTLKPGIKHAIKVAVVINKLDPRSVLMKKDGTDMINLTVWIGKKLAYELKNTFKIGDVVDIIRPRIRAVTRSQNQDFVPNSIFWSFPLIHKNDHNYFVRYFLNIFFLNYFV